MSRTAPCPNCRAVTSLTADNPSRPFCSQRCKLADLGDWLDERHAIPGDPAPEPSDDETGGDTRH